MTGGKGGRSLFVIPFTACTVHHSARPDREHARIAEPHVSLMATLAIFSEFCTRRADRLTQ